VQKKTTSRVSTRPNSHAGNKGENGLEKRESKKFRRGIRKKENIHDQNPINLKREECDGSRGEATRPRKGKSRREPAEKPPSLENVEEKRLKKRREKKPSSLLSSQSFKKAFVERDRTA